MGNKAKFRMGSKVLAVTAVVVVTLLLKGIDGFSFGTQFKDFIWDLNRCSNINPIVDSQTIMLIANGKWPDDKFCTAIRRDLKVNDNTAYNMTTQFINLYTGKIGHLGFLFNVWDDYNYDFVYKRVHDTTFAYGRVFNGVVQFTSGSFGGNPAISSGNWYTLGITVQTNKAVALFLNGQQIGNFTARFTTRGYGGVLIATGYKNTAQFRNFMISPIITQL